jgi:hypothetical protein
VCVRVSCAAIKVIMTILTIFADLVTHCWIDVLHRLNAYPMTNNEPQMWKEAVAACFRGTVAAFVERTEDCHRNARSGYRFPG